MPRLANAWREPCVVVRSMRELPGGGRVCAEVEVAGLVCSLCAARARSGLASLPGVESVEFEPAADRFRVVCRQPLDPVAADRAVRARVVLPGVRRLLARVRRPS